MLFYSYYYICNTNTEMEQLIKKYYTSKEAAHVLGGNERTFRRKASESPLLIRKCADSHYRAPLKNWEKLLGLIN